MSNSYDAMRTYDKMVLDLIFTEGEGNLSIGRSKQSMDAYIYSNATWLQLSSGIWVLNYDGSQQAAVAVPVTKSNLPLDVTSEDMTIMMWVRPNVLGTNIAMIDRRLSGGYAFLIFSNGRLAFTTQQIGPINQISESTDGDVTWNTWQLIAVTRSGSIAEFYINGEILTKQVSALHINPTSISKQMDIGGDVVDPSDHYSGYLDRPRIAIGKVISAEEQKIIFEREKSYYGVV